MSNTAMMMGLSSGAGGVDVADVFSTTLYTGTSSLQTITNGVDLSSNGGFVWTKSRTATSGDSHYVFDTERGAGAALFTNLTNAQSTASGEGVVAFNSDGFDVNGSSRSNTSGVSYVSWTWRKAPKFFDIVTYTGDGVDNRTIAHNLGSVPGMIIVKATSTADQWPVYHRSLGTGALRLNLTNSYNSADTWWKTTPTDSVFTVYGGGEVNVSGVEYVAYLFAHNEDLIQCGSIVGDGTSDREIDLGFEPQWLLIRRSNLGGSWGLFDNKRGMIVGGADPYLLAQDNSAEGSDQNYFEVTPNGFKVGTAGASGYAYNESGDTYIYMAIKAED